MVDVNQPLKIMENIIRENPFEQRKKENRSTVIGLRTTGPGGVAILLHPAESKLLSDRVGWTVGSSAFLPYILHIT